MLSTKDVFKCKYANELKVEEQKKTYHGNSMRKSKELYCYGKIHLKEGVLLETKNFKTIQR